MSKPRLTKKRLNAIIGALNFVLAGEWDDDAHDETAETYEAALDWAYAMFAERERHHER